MGKVGRNVGEAGIISNGAWVWPRTRNTVIQHIIRIPPQPWLPVLKILMGCHGFLQQRGFLVIQHGIPLESVILKWMTVPPHQLFGETECSKVVFHLMATLPKEVSHYRRLRLWGLGIDDSCVLHNQQLENHDPL